jgi:hypothetical protein
VGLALTPGSGGSERDGWYVGNPDLTVAETRRLKRLGEDVDEFLDKVGN